MNIGRGVKRAKRCFFADMSKSFSVKKWHLWHKGKCAKRINGCL